MPPRSATTRPDDPDVQETVRRIGSRFAVAGEFVLGEVVETGLINATYRATYESPSGERERYILQSINHHVFRDPLAVMQNVERVTRHINQRVLRLKKDLGGQTLSLFPARDGAMHTRDDDGNIWRCYNFIEGCVTYDVVENTRQAWQAAHAFGAFQDLVSDLDPASIIESIPDFHDTGKRFARLSEVMAGDPVGRLDSVRAECDAIVGRVALSEALLGSALRGEIPLRVTHNDTKVNNVMIDAATDEAVCVIDLDTVMPGLAGYDFGDLVRTACTPVAEDETDLSLVRVRLPMFEALVEGYLASAGAFLSDAEVATLVTACKVMTYEVALRFLTDYLEGDVYFKVRRPGHNLDRCRNQLRLLACMEESGAEMEGFVAKVWRARRKTR
ncbi:MAG: aminoglycoside phosphotransferase family protein [Akkermansiaceae bacterium]|nr:aminoglycoside phosphotransferase family protein [Akkermansiaceae bacterium]MCP5543936.1 aminoglycoside phosphotransferase family protein [Akkermansiaceae bacterium]MCP5547568.1 aminoglycoside phosphotransferase family protein [Akkermansiaceae bacterium]